MLYIGQVIITSCFRCSFYPWPVVSVAFWLGQEAVKFSILNKCQSLNCLHIYVCVSSVNYILPSSLASFTLWESTSVLQHVLKACVWCTPGFPAISHVRFGVNASAGFVCHPQPVSRLCSTRTMFMLHVFPSQSQILDVGISQILVIAILHGGRTRAGANRFDQ